MLFEQGDSSKENELSNKPTVVNVKFLEQAARENNGSLQTFFVIGVNAAAK